MSLRDFMVQRSKSPQGPGPGPRQGPPTVFAQDPRIEDPGMTFTPEQAQQTMADITAGRITNYRKPGERFSAGEQLAGLAGQLPRDGASRPYTAPDRISGADPQHLLQIGAARLRMLQELGIEPGPGSGGFRSGTSGQSYGVYRRSGSSAASEGLGRLGG